MAICLTSLRMFMRHSELRQICRHVSCGTFWKRKPATTLLLTEWIPRRQAYCTDKCDDSSNSGQKTNNAKDSQSKSGTTKAMKILTPTTTSSMEVTTETMSAISSSDKAATTTTTPKTTTRTTTRMPKKYDKQNFSSKTDTTNKVNSSESESFSSTDSDNFDAKSKSSTTTTTTFESLKKGDDDDADTGHRIDFAPMKITDLKKELRAHGLSVGGKKNILIERLQNYLQQQQEKEHNKKSNNIEEEPKQKEEESSLHTKKNYIDEIANVTTTKPTETKIPTETATTAIMAPKEGCAYVPETSNLYTERSSMNLERKHSLLDTTNRRPQKNIIASNEPTATPTATPTAAASTTRTSIDNYNDTHEQQRPLSHNLSSAAVAATSSSSSNVQIGNSNSYTAASNINHNTMRKPLSGAPSVAAAAADTCQKHGDVSVEYVQGLPHFTIPLPSRNEKCRFVLKPITHRVGDLINMLRIEDRGIDRAVVLNEAGVRISSTCNIESLLDAPFWLHINDQKYKVIPPQRDRIECGDIDKLGDIRILVAQLYEALNVGEHYLKKESEMMAKLEDLKYKVAPLERKFDELNIQASRKSGSLMWVGLGLMSVQFGILARLTWWEYSWDIMEPVTYFVTYGTTMAAFAYYCVTKQEYNMPEVKERQYLLDIHKRAKRANFDIDSYNNLKRQIAEIEYDLRRLKDPLNMQLPPHVDRSLEYTPAALCPPSSSSDSSSSLSTSSCGGVSTRQTSKKSGFRIPFLEPKN